MNILVFGMNYIPEKTAIGPLTAALCEDLVDRGHHVTVVTGFPHFPEWQIYDNYRGKLFMRETLNGVSLRRGFVYVSGKPKTFQRILYDSSIAVSALINVNGCRHPDRIIVVSPPLQIVFTAILLGKMWRVPVLLIVKDIVPDVAINLHMLKNESIIRLARSLEKFCYRHVDHISVISQGFFDNLLSKNIQREKLTLIPDFVDVDTVKPMDRNNAFRSKHNIDSEIFIVLYCGNISTKQGLENIVYTAGRLEDQNKIRFYIVGEGCEKQNLINLSEQHDFHNITFLPFEPEQMFPNMLAAADILLLNQKADVQDSVLPCKLLNYMAAGRPVIAAVNLKSETAVYLDKAKCGIAVEPEKPDALAEAIRVMRKDDPLRNRLGENGRSFAESYFSRQQVLNCYANLIEGMN